MPFHVFEMQYEAIGFVKIAESFLYYMWTSNKVVHNVGLGSWPVSFTGPIILLYPEILYLMDKYVSNPINGHSA